MPVTKPDINPPEWINRILHWFINPDILEEIEGDLLEVYRTNRLNKKHANWIYFRQVLSFLKFENLKRLKMIPYTFIEVIRSSFKLGFRNLGKQKLFSFINVFGLAVAMSVGLIILSIIHDLFRYDNFHSNKDNIYRIITNVKSSDGEEKTYANTFSPLSEHLNQVSAMEEIVTIRRYFVGTFEKGQSNLEIQGYFTNPNFLSVFDFPMIEGNRNTCLSEPYSIVLTKSLAFKLFNSLDVVGKTIQIAPYGEFIITGTMLDPPKNSHLQFESLVSSTSIPIFEDQQLIQPSSELWDQLYYYYTYFTMDEGANREEVERILNQLYRENHQSKDSDIKISIQSLNSILPGRDLEQQIGPKFTYVPIFILGSLAFLILLSACINYSHLSIARALKRSREVGVRKILGGRKTYIFLQFMVETILISMMALVVSVLLFYYIQPYVLTHIPRASEMLTLELTHLLIIYFVGFALFTGLLAGFTPSLYFIKFSPLQLFRNAPSIGTQNRPNIRNILIGFQFILSLVFVLATGLIYKQYLFNMNFEMGFTKENILNIPLKGTDPEMISNAFSGIPEVSDISLTNNIHALGANTRTYLKYGEMEDSTYTYYMSVNDRFLNVFDIDLIAGKNFTNESLSGNEIEILINEEFLESFEIQSASEAIGQSIELEGKPVLIAGVVRNFNYALLEDPIQPFFLRNDPGSFRYINLKISSTNIQETLGKLETKWKEQAPDLKFEARFFDEQLQDAYGFLTNIMRIFGYLAILAVTISSLGLLGIAVYTVESRKREIGIRKVMGASVLELIQILSRNYLIIIALSIPIACTLIYLLFDKVLFAFNAYRPELAVLDFVLGIGFLVGLSLLIVISQTYKAANSNPSEIMKED